MGHQCVTPSTSLLMLLLISLGIVDCRSLYSLLDSSSTGGISVSHHDRRLPVLPNSTSNTHTHMNDRNVQSSFTQPLVNNTTTNSLGSSPTYNSSSLHHEIGNHTNLTSNNELVAPDTATQDALNVTTDTITTQPPNNTANHTPNPHNPSNETGPSVHNETNHLTNSSIVNTSNETGSSIQNETNNHTNSSVHNAPSITNVTENSMPKPSINVTTTDTLNNTDNHPPESQHQSNTKPYSHHSRAPSPRSHHHRFTRSPSHFHRLNHTYKPKGKNHKNHSHTQDKYRRYKKHPGDDSGSSTFSIFIFLVAASILIFKFERWRRGRAMRARAENMTGMSGNLYMHADYV